MKPEVYISLAALAFAIVSFVVSFGHSVRARRAEFRPVVAIVYTDESGWVIRNVGSGPALNIVVAQSWDSGKDREWSEPVRVPPLASGGEFHLHWIGHSNVRAIGAAYSDFEGRSYSSICEDDHSRAIEGRTLPDWPTEEVSRHWWEAPAVGNRGDRRRTSGTR
jgi:hypothetical protein